jgi:hypothetical protein
MALKDWLKRRRKGGKGTPDVSTSRKSSAEDESPTFDLKGAIDLKRFHTARRTSANVMEPFRKVRAVINREMAGPWYSRTGSQESYVNKISTTANILSMALAYNNPKIEVKSWNPKLWPFARRWTETINRQIANMGFRDTFYEATLDATVLWGILKIRLAESGYVETTDNQWVMPGQVAMDRVSFDDLIIDLSPKSDRYIRFIGDWYRASYRKVRNRDDFDEEVVKKIGKTSKFTTPDTGEDYSQQISTHYQVDDDELEPMVWLCDVYFPETHQFVTFSDRDELWPLKIEDDVEIGPNGPYELLSLGLVPDNIIPSSPLHHLMAMHRAINDIFRKSVDQALAQKNVFAVRPGEESAGRQWKNARNNEFIVTTSAPDQVSIRGVDGPTMAFWLQMGEVYNTQSGNERALGGLGIESPTATQEQQMLGQAGGLIGRMRSKVEQCAQACARKIGIEMWESETLTVEGSREVEQTGFHVPATWRPKSRDPEPGEGPTREGLRDNYDFMVRANSMGYRPPEAELKAVYEFGQMLTTMLPLIQAGKMDGEAFTDFAAEKLNCPDMKRIFRVMLVEAAGDSDPHQATKPANTSREVVRRSGAGPQGGGLATVVGQMMQGQNAGGGGAMVSKGG